MGFGLFEQICWTVRDIFRLSPTEIYEKGNWYIVLSCYVNYINEKGREVYESSTPEERSKRGIKKELITKKIEFNEDIKPSSIHRSKTLNEVINERNRESIN